MRVLCRKNGPCKETLASGSRYLRIDHFRTPAPENPLAPAKEYEDVPAGVELCPGQVVRLDPGEAVTVGQPADSGTTYEPLLYQTSLQISAALGIPPPFLANNMVILERAACPGRVLRQSLHLATFADGLPAPQTRLCALGVCSSVVGRAGPAQLRGEGHTVRSAT